METVKSMKVNSPTSDVFFMVKDIRLLETPGFFEAFCDELAINVRFFKGDDSKFYLENNQ